MPDTTHDPPSSTAVQPDVRPDLDALRAVGFEKYHLVKDRIGREPIALINEMRTGGYRYKCVRGKPGVLVMRRGEPVVDLMSFRQIAPELERLSQVQVSYETVRRWWDVAYPAGDPAPAKPYDGPLQPKAPRAVRRRTGVAKPAAAGTNPAIPAAEFLPPPSDTLDMIHPKLPTNLSLPYQY